MNRTLIYTSLTVLALQGCATPHVVESKKIDDNQLSCNEITSQIAEADRFESAARDERKVTGTNVAAALFFWPALLATYSNTEEAIEAARERKEHLTDLYTERGCS
ncbi:MAG: hypothetical protein ABW078_03635 [Sedimenticola sp.]